MSFLCCLSVMLVITVLSTLAFPDRLDVLQHQCEPIYRKTQKDESQTDGGQPDRISSKRRGAPECVTDATEMLCHEFIHQKDANSEITSVNIIDEKPSCILLRRENIPARLSVQLVELHMELEPGMKMIVQGRSAFGASSSQLTISMDPKNPTNPLKWFHTGLNWKRRAVNFKKGFSSQTFSGDFPISDRFNFTLTFQVTESKTEIYADNVLVKKIGVIPGLCEFNIQSFSGIHVLVVKKTDGECQNVSDGIH